MPPMRGAVEKIDKPFKILGRVFKEVFKIHPYALFVIFALIITSSFASMIAIKQVETIVDSLQTYIAKNGSYVGFDFNIIVNSAIIMSCLYVYVAIASYTYQRIGINVSQDTLQNIRDGLFKHMETLPLKYFDSRTTGSVMSLYTNDVDALRQLLAQSIPQLLSSVFTMIFSIIMMISISPILMIITVFFSVIMMIAAKYLTSSAGKFFIKQQVNVAAVNGFIEEMIEGAKVVKVFNHEDEAIKDFKVINENLEKSNFLANMFAGIVGPVTNNIGYVSFACTAVIGAILVGSGTGIFALTVGGLATYLLYAKNFSMPINQIANQLNSIMMALAGAKRIFDVLDMESEVDEGEVTLVNVIKEGETLTETKNRTGHWAWKTREGNLIELKGDVRFFDVDFGYTDEKMVLHNISLYAQPGQKIAFVGSTGAGKTTITNLINRFYDVQDGKIKYDGININHIRKKDLRKSLGIVLQDTHLFSGTIAENIAYGKEDATREEIVAAATLANANHFIDLLPQGYDTYITGDGENLSQGQRQLLSISRAAIIDPPVLILDEATSSIDTWTESLVQKGMDSLMSERTVFVIAHRLSTVRDSNAIMVLEKGVIIERGDHDDLLAQKGKYYQLYTGAFELE